MNNKTKIWLDSHPDSDQPLDTERWLDAVLESLETGNHLDFNEIQSYIKEHKKWGEVFRKDFQEKKESEYSLLKSFYFHIESSK